MTVAEKSSVVWRILVLTLLLAVSAVSQSVSLSGFHDEQIWGHLRAGTWILENKSWPHTGLLSQAVNLPWRDFSWGSDIGAALAYRSLGLLAVPLILMSFRFALAAIAFVLVGGLRGNLWSAVALSAVAQYVLVQVGPGPTCISVVLFGIELLLLLEVRRSANLRLLYALPLLFLLWANLDIGFVYGIGLYVLFLADLSTAQARWFQVPTSERIPAGTAWLVGTGCVLATLVTPYGHHGYVGFFAEEFSAANEYLTVYRAMSFHQSQDYVLLLLAMTAFLALGMRRSRDVFLLAALAATAFLAFHAQREGWLAILISVAVIGDSITAGNKQAEPLAARIWKWQGIAVALAVALIFSASLRMPRSREQLLAKVAEDFPVAASDYVREHHLPTPLFNSYRWGGFLTWYLPEYPVAIDARRGLYPEQQETDYFKAMNVEIPYQSLEPMTRARTLLMDKSEVLADALRGVSGFHVVYEDQLAIILMQRTKE